MASAAAYRTEHVAETPRGYRVRSIKRGGHVVRVAFPPGPRRKGAGSVVEILHPRSEKNPRCEVGEQARKNPGELLIFGNPSAHRGKGNPSGGNASHKPGCKCFACEHARKNPGSRKPVHTVMGRKFKGETQKEAESRAMKHFGLRGKRAARKSLAGATKRANPRRRRTDRNPAEEPETRKAVKLFEIFHGKEASGITEKHVSAVMRLDYTALGSLDYLKVVTPLGQRVTFDFEGDGVKLASSPDGRQLYCIGGNQNVERCIDAESLQKDFIDLGDGTEVAYTARKIHGDFQPIQWFHKFGEVSGSMPRLMYDKLRKQIFFLGGDYRIDTNVAISPGIEN